MIEITRPFELRTRARVRRERDPSSAPLRRPSSRIARQLALAHTLQRRLESGDFPNAAAMARVMGLTRARVTQLLNLLSLAPDIQEEILHLEDSPESRQLNERVLRKVTQKVDWAEQRKLWTALHHSH